MSEDVIEGTGVELEPQAPAAVPVNLFRTDNPAEVLKRAQETADALMPVVRKQNLVSNIQGREHLRVEAWTTLGAMLGVTPVCEWTRKLENGWEARVEARTLDGRVIGAAEAECLRDESTWKNRDDYALRSMAQTRATSKALASVLRFVATLGGAAGTPAEEMPSTPDGPIAPSDKQLAFLARLLKDNGIVDPDLHRIEAYAREKLTGGKGGSCSKVIDGIKEGRDGILDGLVNAAKAWDADSVPDVPADTEGLPNAA